MKGRNKPSRSINISHSPKPEPQHQYDDKVGSVRNIVSNPPPTATLHSEERKTMVNRSNTHRPPPKMNQTCAASSSNKDAPSPLAASASASSSASSSSSSSSNPFGMDNMQYYQYKTSMFERIRMYGDGQPQLKKYPRIQYLGNALCCPSVLAKFFTMKIRPYSSLHKVFLEDILFFIADFVDLDVLRKEKDKALPKITKIVNCTYDSNLQSTASIETCYSELMDEVIKLVESTDEIKKKNKENEKIKELVERDEVQRALDELSTKFRDELQKIVNHVNEKFNELNVYFQTVEALQSKITDIESNIIEISAIQSQVNDEIIKQQGEMEKVILENEKLQNIVNGLSSQTKETLTLPSVDVDIGASEKEEKEEKGTKNENDTMDMFTRLAGQMGTRLFGPEGMFRVDVEGSQYQDPNFQGRVKQAHDMIENLFGFGMNERASSSAGSSEDDEGRIEELSEADDDDESHEKTEEAKNIDEQNLQDIIKFSSGINESTNEREKRKRKGKERMKKEDEDAILDFDADSTLLDNDNPYNFFAEGLD